MQTGNNSIIRRQSCHKPFCLCTHIVILQSMKAVAHSIQLSGRGIAIVFIYADEWCYTHATNQVVLIIVYIVGQYILIVNDKVETQFVGGLEPKIAQGIVTLITCADKYAFLIGIAE